MRAVVVLSTLLVLAGVATAGERACDWCGALVRGSGVRWASKRFCSEECKDDHYRDYEESRRRCRICDVSVDPPRNDGFVGHVPWDGYCSDCRAGVRDGTIDPIRDKWNAVVHEPEEARGPRPPVEPRANRKPGIDGDERGSGFGYFAWAAAIGGLLWKVVRWLYGSRRRIQSVKMV